MSPWQYRDATRAELWEILQIQLEETQQLTAELDELVSHNSELKRWVYWGIQNSSDCFNAELARKCITKQAEGVMSIESIKLLLEIESLSPIQCAQILRELEQLTAERDSYKIQGQELVSALWAINRIAKTSPEDKAILKILNDCDLTNLLAKRDLESESNGVGKAITHYVQNYSKSKLSVDEFLAVYEEKLIKQAEGL